MSRVFAVLTVLLVTSSTTTAYRQGVNTTRICGATDVVPSGDFTLINNLWGYLQAPTPKPIGFQCSNIVSRDNFSIAWDLQSQWAAGQGSVKGFTNVQQNKGAGTQLSQIASLPSRWDFVINTTKPRDIAYNLAYDFFTMATPSASAPITNEVMIWPAYQYMIPVSTKDSNGKYIYLAQNVSLAGYNWLVYYGQRSGANVYSFVNTGPIPTSFQADMMLFFNWLAKGKYIDPAQYLNILQAGAEIIKANYTDISTSYYSLDVNSIDAVSSSSSSSTSSARTSTSSSSARVTSTITTLRPTTSTAKVTSTSSSATRVSTSASSNPSTVPKNFLCGIQDNTTTGSYTLWNNLWGVRVYGNPGPGYQCSGIISQPDVDAISWVVDFAWANGPNVKGFSNVQQIKGMGQQLSNIASIPTTWQYAMNTTKFADLTYSVAYDLYTGPTSNGTIGGPYTTEVMVWLSNHYMVPPTVRNSANQPAPLATNVVLPLTASFTWTVYGGVVNGRNVYTFVNNGNPPAKFKEDLMVFLNYLVANKKMSANEYLNVLQAGTNALKGPDSSVTTYYYKAIVVPKAVVSSSSSVSIRTSSSSSSARTSSVRTSSSSSARTSSVKTSSSSSSVRSTSTSRSTSSVRTSSTSSPARTSTTSSVRTSSTSSRVTTSSSSTRKTTSSSSARTSSTSVSSVKTSSTSSKPSSSSSSSVSRTSTVTTISVSRTSSSAVVSPTASNGPLNTTQICGIMDNIKVGSYIMWNNLWGIRAFGNPGPGYQCSHLVGQPDANSVSWTLAYKWTDSLPTVKGYSNIQQFENLGYRLNDIASIPSTWSYSMNTTKYVNLAYNVAYDFFTMLTPDNTTADAPHTNEIMVWTSVHYMVPVTARDPTTNKPVPLATNLFLGNGNYNFTLYGGTNSYGGVFTFVNQGPPPVQFKEDMMIFFNYLIQRKLINGTDYLNVLQAGSESIKGDATSITTHYYKINVNPKAGAKQGSASIATTPFPGGRGASLATSNSSYTQSSTVKTSSSSTKASSTTTKSVVSTSKTSTSTSKPSSTTVTSTSKPSSTSKTSTSKSAASSTTSAKPLPTGWILNATCIQDTAAPKQLLNTTYTINNLTVNGCIGKCQTGGFLLAGVEASNVCLCGNKLQGRAVNTTTCDVPCAGDKTVSCGGKTALTLFRRL